ncbi:MAG TPA: rod shape-determining protein RodA [Persephonella sp.]|uniref:Peptidoglycan glycosyltransferase RodA n=1 Tax=Persephonella marina (strain DSM 14350 / EX-H1) TaxID=123214 RepID=C0QT36_PERMH|nr:MULTISPECIES: rod shape-determining protein RodA [Persephonella]ACO04263.1 rod shape-determining protein RodA [Persephonella marina EX-H1]HCB70530.1 rod shape-determining protein RodA [Persephonella sp.]
MKNIKTFFSRYDPVILFTVLGLLTWSVINIYSATFHEYSSLYIKQAVYALIGTFIILIFPSLDYRKLLNAAPYLYITGILLLIAVIFFGTTILGAKRWIKLGFFMIQPSEMMKFIIILMVAYILENSKRVSFIEGLKIFVLSTIPFILILKQPDLGTAITVLIPVVIILFLANLNKKYIIATLSVLVLSAPFIWEHLKDYQKKRILAFLNPEADPFGTAYHILQSKIAIGSGYIFGKGYLQGTQSKLFFLPEQHTDFIFATIGEEWGFVVSITILTAYLILGLRILYLGSKIKYYGGKYICYGAGGLITVQAFINIAMTVGLAPVVGITLPFLSYGGSSVVTFSLIVGTVLSVIYTHKRERLHF